MRRVSEATRAALAFGLAGVLVASLLLVFAAHFVRVAPAPEAGARSAPTPAGHSSVGLAALLGAGDGQAYAAIARDPSLARPQLLASDAEYAYRAQRPLFGELGWILSVGRPGRVSLALAALSAISAGIAVTALALALRRLGVPPRFALGLFLIPAAAGIVWGMTPELLEVGLITFGVLAWTAESRRVVTAVVALALAAVTRESMLFVPLALAVIEVRRDPWRDGMRRSAPLAIPFAAYGVWIAFVRARVGFWPFAARADRLTLVPFSGLIQAVRQSSDRWTALAWIVVGLLVVFAALRWGRRGPWYAVAVSFLVLAPFLGSAVWGRPADFGRVLFPLFVYSAMLVLDACWRRRPAEVMTHSDPGAGNDPGVRYPATRVDSSYSH